MKKVTMTLGLLATLLIGSIPLLAGSCCDCCKDKAAACCKAGCEACDCCK